jgi:hypothetical protein
MYIFELKRKFKLMDFSSTICKIDSNKFYNFAFNDSIYCIWEQK